MREMMMVLFEKIFMPFFQSYIDFCVGSVGITFTIEALSSLFSLLSPQTLLLL
jgi:hypothetical protein